MDMNRGRAIWTRALPLVALMVLTLTASQCGGRRSEQFREQGDTYLRLEKPGDALTEYARALSSNPKNAPAKLGVARAHRMQQHLDDAITAYREAIVLDPNLSAAYFELADLFFHQGKTTDAEALAKELQGRNPEQGGMLMAHIQQLSGRADEAITTLTALQTQFPKSSDVRVALAGEYLVSGQAGKAEEIARAGLKDIGPEVLTLRMMLIEAYHAQGKVGELIGELEGIVKEQEARVAQAPNDQAAAELLDNQKLALARALAESGRTDDAEVIARPILAARPDFGWANYVMGICLTNKKAYADALPYLQTAAHALPQNQAVMDALANAQSGGKDGAAKAAPATAAPAASVNTAAAASATASRPTPAPGEETWRDLWEMGSLPRLVGDREHFLATGGPNAKETIALAALFVGERSAAQEIIAGLPADNPLHSYLTTLDERDFKKVTEAFEAWKEADPDRILLKNLAQGFCYGLNGAGMQALGVYSQCLRDYPQNGVSLYNLAMYYASAAGMPEFAMGSLRRLIAMHPQNMDARRRLFSILIRESRFDEARELAESTYSLYPADKDAALSLGQIYVTLGQTDLALQVIQKGLDNMPGDPTLSLAQSAALLQSDKLDEAQKTLDTVKPTPGLVASAATLGANIAAMKGDWASVVKQCETAPEGERGPACRLLLAAALLQQGTTDNAAKAITGGIAPTSPQLIPYRVLLKALGQDARCADDEAALAGKLAGKPDLMAQYALAMAYREQRLFDRSIALFEALLPKVDDSSAVLMVMANTIGLDRGGADPEERLTALATKYAKAPVPLLALADVYKERNEVDKESVMLDKALQLAPDSLIVLLRRAEFFERRNNMKQAEQTYRRLLEMRPDDASTQNNLAYTLLRSGGDTKQALDLATSAAKSFGNNPSVLHTLGLAQIRSGNIEEGRKNLIIALEQRPGDPAMLLDFGKLLIDQGREEEGKNYVRLALVYTDQLSLSFDRRAEAEAIVGKAAAT